MNTAQALTKLRKLLGKNAGIKDYKRPSSPEQREADHQARLAANKHKAAAQAAMEARRENILAADAEYQRLYSEYKAARAVQEATPHGIYFRYSAGIINDWFFSVRAEADTLAELIEKVEAKETA